MTMDLFINLILFLIMCLNVINVCDGGSHAPTPIEDKLETTEIEFVSPRSFVKDTYQTLCVRQVGFYIVQVNNSGTLYRQVLHHNQVRISLMISRIIQIDPLLSKYRNVH